MTRRKGIPVGSMTRWKSLKDPDLCTIHQFPPKDPVMTLAIPSIYLCKILHDPPITLAPAMTFARHTGNTMAFERGHPTTQGAEGLDQLGTW